MEVEILLSVFPKKGLHSVWVEVAEGLSWVVLLMGHLPAGFRKAFESICGNKRLCDDGIIYQLTTPRVYLTNTGIS